MLGKRASDTRTHRTASFDITQHQYSQAMNAAKRKLFSLLSVGGVSLGIETSHQPLLGCFDFAHLHIVASPCDGVAQPSNVERLLDDGVAQLGNVQRLLAHSQALLLKLQALLLKLLAQLNAFLQQLVEHASVVMVDDGSQGGDSSSVHGSKTSKAGEFQTAPFDS